MSAHHDNHDNHSNESKPVAFRTPIILALVTVLIMVLAVNTCDGKKHHDCECSEPCETEMEHGKADHHAAATHEHATDAADHNHSDTTKVAH